MCPIFKGQESKKKRLGWKGNHWIQKTGIEDSKGNETVDQKQVLQIWENYITEYYDLANRLENPDVEHEEQVNADKKRPYILQSEVEKAIKKMRNKKATGDDDVPGDVFKLLREDGLGLMTQQINNIRETGERLKDFIKLK
jgi:hypothetical protein